jgi:hypothetical protein
MVQELQLCSVENVFDFKPLACFLDRGRLFVCGFARVPGEKRGLAFGLVNLVALLEARQESLTF